MDIHEIVSRLMETFEAGDLEGFGELVHDDVESRLVLCGGKPIRGKAAYLAALADAKKRVLVASPRQVTVVDDGAAIIVGRLQYPLRPSGIADSAACWTVEVRDGKVFRVTAFATDSEAREWLAARALDDRGGRAPTPR